MPLKSPLELIADCDNFPYPTSTSLSHAASSAPEYYHLTHHSTLLGYIPASIYSRMPWDANVFELDASARTVEVRGSNPAERSAQLAAFLGRVRAQGIFRVLDGWRDELYPVYGGSEGKGRGEVLFSLERAAAALLGVVCYGVHMTGYVRDQAGGLGIWTPRRAWTKQTYPGMMDNTAAGGLAVGERVLDCLVREASEEASLPGGFVREKARACGTVSYFHVRDERAGGETGLCMPECQYVYDLEMPAEMRPVPGDDEAVDFRLLSVQEVRVALAEGRFKPNCAVVLIDFLVRHGILTPENEADYVEVVSRLHRRLEFPMA